ncbi:hypothetical protein WME91_41060 [Sorangium sp. So ce269]
MIARRPTTLAFCQDHPNATAAARCASCNRALCNACFCFRMDGCPACARCAYEASTRPGRRPSLAVAFLCFTLGGGAWFARRHDLWDEMPVALAAGALVAIAVAAAIGASGRGGDLPAVEHRDPDEDEIDERAFSGRGAPYRASARRALLAASPRLSGSATAIVMIASLAASAVLLPASLKLPRWIEAELVLALWWVIVTTTLAALLHRGFRLRDDFVYFAPWSRPALPGEPRGSGGALSKGVDVGVSVGCESLGGADIEGCVVIIALGLALSAAFGAAWVAVELATPLAFFLMYWLFMRAIGRVANDHHGCEGDLPRSIRWGALWATLYVLPVAAIAWAVHALGR